MDSASPQALADLLERRFGERFEVPAELAGADELLRIAAHASHRQWAPQTVPAALVRVLAACALSAPSKSDLQQATIIDVRDPTEKAAIAALLPQLPWLGSAPAFLVFCGDRYRLRRTFERRGQRFPNEHLDQFFNATVDAALVMMNFLRAASAAGLVHCPISLVRNRPGDLDRLLGLPDHVFPVAGLCLGYPAAPVRARARLPLGLTLQVDRYDDSALDELLDTYDERCMTLRREAGAAVEAWTQEKFVQYSVPQRTDWGTYIQSKMFSLK